MATKFCRDAAMNAALQDIIDNTERMFVCTTDIETTGAPDYAKVVAQLGTGDGTALITGEAIVPADFTISDGDVSGRKAVLKAFPSVAVTQDGGAQCVVLVNDTNTEVLYVASTTVQNLTSGSNVAIPAWSFEFRDPI